MAAVIGGGSSSRTILGQYVFGMAGIPQVGVTSTAPTLSDRRTYPTFSRVVPSDEAQGRMLAQVVADFGWTYVSVLSTTDDYARELTTIFQGASRGTHSPFHSRRDSSPHSHPHRPFHSRRGTHHLIPHSPPRPSPSIRGAGLAPPFPFAARD